MNKKWDQIKKRGSSMAHAFVMLAFLALAILIIPDVAYAAYDVSYNCEEQCVHNKSASWQVTLLNDGSTDILLVQLSLQQIGAPNPFAYGILHETITTTPDVIGSTNPPLRYIEPGETYTEVINGSLPYPSNDSKLHYKLCAKTMREETLKKLPLFLDFCYPGEFVIPMIDCSESTDCFEDEHCQKNKCVPLDCGYCSYIENHTCLYHSCCADSECLFSQSCKDHGCLDIPCNETNFLFNHTCVEVPCDEGQVMMPDMLGCEEADCRFDEHQFRFRCEPLNCSYDQGYLNNTCVDLNCSDNEGYINHMCANLTCGYTQATINHTCADLSCGLLMKPEEHECRLNSVLIIEFALLCVILGLFFSDMAFYKSAYRRKLAKYLMQKAKARKQQPEADGAKEDPDKISDDDSSEKTDGQAKDTPMPDSAKEKQ